MANGGDQNREVLHTSCEYCAYDDPKKARGKAKLRCECRADERARAGNGGKVMPEQNPLGRRDEIATILMTMCGSKAGVVEHQGTSGDEGTVVSIGERIDTENAHENRQCIHFSRSGKCECQRLV